MRQSDSKAGFRASLIQGGRKLTFDSLGGAKINFPSPLHAQCSVFSAWADPWADPGQTPMVFGQTPSEDCVAHGTPTAQNNQELIQIA